MNSVEYKNHTSYCLDRTFRLLMHSADKVALKDIFILSDCSKMGLEKSQFEDALNKSGWFVSDEKNLWELVNWEFIFPNRKLKDIPIIVTDIETTGSRPNKDRVFEIAAVKIGPNGDEFFHHFINPGFNLPWQIRRLTGVKDRDLVNCPTFEEVSSKFQEFASGGIFCAHNADFDFDFLSAEYCRLGMEFFTGVPELCSLRLTKHLYPKIQSPGLLGLSKEFSLPFEDRHSALEDAKLTREILGQFLCRLNEIGIDDFYGLINCQLRFDKKNRIQSKVARKKHRSRKHNRKHPSSQRK